MWSVIPRDSYAKVGSYIYRRFYITKGMVRGEGRLLRVEPAVVVSCREKGRYRTQLPLHSLYSGVSPSTSNAASYGRPTSVSLYFEFFKYCIVER